MAPNSPILGSQTRQNVMSGQAGISAQNVGAAINPQSISSPEDIQALQVTQQNQVQIQSLQVGLNGIQNQLATLNTGLTNISTLIQNDTAAQQQILLDQQNKERILDEQKVRSGKESEIEQKITQTFEGAATKINQQLTGLFGRVNTALLFLLGGWASTKWSELINAEQQKNTELVVDIKRSILEGIRNFGTGFILLKSGLTGTITNILALAGRIGSFVIGKPFRSLQNLARRLRGLEPLTSRGSRPSISRGVKRMLPGRIGRGAQTAIEAAQGNPLETGLGLASFLPGKFGLLSGALQMGENISELFGVNEGQGFIPDGTYEPVLNTETGDFKNPFSNFDVGSFFGFGGEDNKEETVQPEPQSSANVEPQEVSLSPEDLEAYNNALKNKDNPFAQGIIKSKFNELTPEKQQQFRDYAAQQGDDFGDLIPPAPVQPMSGIMSDKATQDLQVGETNAEVQQAVQEEKNFVSSQDSSEQSTMIASNPESMQPPPPKMDQLPKLSEPAPQIIAANAQQNQQSGLAEAPSTSDSISLVPTILTSNSDTAQYTMLSMSIYNAVA